MNKCLIMSTILLASCASGPFKKTEPKPPTPKHEFFTKVDYMGKSRYSIRSVGRQNSEVLRQYLHERAFYLCKAKGLGVEFVEDVKQVTEQEASLLGPLYYHGYSTVVKCEGPVEQELAEKYANPEMMD